MPSSGDKMNSSILLVHIEKPGMHLFVLSAPWSVSIPGSTPYKSEPCIGLYPRSFDREVGIATELS